MSKTIKILLLIIIPKFEFDSSEFLKTTNLVKQTNSVKKCIFMLLFS